MVLLMSPIIPPGIQIMAVDKGRNFTKACNKVFEFLELFFIFINL